MCKEVLKAENFLKAENDQALIDKKEKKRITKCKVR